MSRGKEEPPITNKDDITLNGGLQGGLKASSDTLANTAMPVTASTTPLCSIKR